jgi:hypothetical protein
MPKLYEVTGHSIVVAPGTKGFDPEGKATESRQWFAGSRVYVDPADVDSLFAAGAIGPVGEPLATRAGPEAEAPPSPAVEDEPDSSATPDAVPSRRRGR